jgi:hypothetical protein
MVMLGEVILMLRDDEIRAIKDFKIDQDVGKPFLHLCIRGGRCNGFEGNSALDAYRGLLWRACNKASVTPLCATCGSVLGAIVLELLCVVIATCVGFNAFMPTDPGSFASWIAYFDVSARAALVVFVIFLLYYDSRITQVVAKPLGAASAE